MIRIITSTIIILFICEKSNAQLLSTEGKEFWLSFLNINRQEKTLSIYITAQRPCTASLKSADGYFNQNVYISPTAATIVDVTNASLYTDINEVISLKGLYIQATDTINVYASNSAIARMDITKVLPVTSLGSEYVILDYAFGTSANGDPPISQFLVLGVEDNTEVELYPRYPSTAGTSNTPFVITLNKGQTYLYAANADLTGSRVRAKNCKKIAVFTGSPCTFIPDCLGCDNLFEQNFPVNTLGTNFLVSRSVTRGSDYIKILATQNNTEVYFNNTLATVLNTGSSYETYLDQPIYIRATKPVITAFMGVSGRCTSGDGDPFMIYVTPIEQAIETSTLTTVHENQFRRQFVNIHVRTQDKNLTFYDGQNIGNRFTPFPGNAEYSFARIEMSKGVHTIKNAKKFTAYVYAFENSISYGYSAGSLLNKSDQFALVNGISSNLQKEFYFCPPAPVTFKAVTQDTLFSQISWQFSDGTTLNGNSVSKNFANPGCYDVKMITTYNGSSGTCRLADDDTISMKVCVLNSLPLSIGNDTSFCKGGSLQLASNINPAGFSYIWSTGESTSSIEVNKSGDYWLELRNGNCAVRDTAKVMITDKPILSLGTKQFLCVNDSLLLKNSVNENGVTYTWSNGAVGYSQWVNQPGMYKLYASSGGCTNEDSVKVELMTCPAIYVPSAFTPNGDGLNDVIRPIVAGMELHSFRIYDRWGNLVFETTERLKGWNGNRKEKRQPTGTYVYVAEAKDKNGKLYQKKGTFVLIR